MEKQFFYSVIYNSASCSTCTCMMRASFFKGYTKIVVVRRFSKVILKLQSNRLDLVAQLAEHWTRVPKVASSIGLPLWSGKLLSLPGVDTHSE